MLLVHTAFFNIKRTIITINTTEPIVPSEMLPDKSIGSASPTTANIARRIPTRPSPAISPEQKRIPPLASLSLSLSLDFLSTK